MAHILIVEDDDFLRQLLSSKLSKKGYDVSEAESGERGVSVAADNTPDIVLLDLLLPGIDGFEVLSRLRRNKETEGLPVIIFSNLGDEEDIEKGFRLGATDYLVKSNFTPSDIVNKIEAALGS